MHKDDIKMKDIIPPLMEFSAQHTVKYYIINNYHMSIDEVIQPACDKAKNGMKFILLLNAFSF